MSTPSHPPQPTPLRILVVDDDEVDRLRIERMLRSAPDWQVQIDAAVDKATGLAMLRANPYDCVLLDYRLPDGHGLELLTEIQAARGDCPPIIMQTTLNHDQVAIQSLAQGAQDYLVKGQFDSPLLQRTIRYAIQRDQLVKERNRLTRELEQALAEVKTLRGLLPICGFCKKIRTENHEWVPFERYISDRSEASFTHGFCPECGKKHYGDYFAKILERQSGPDKPPAQ